MGRQVSHYSSFVTVGTHEQPFDRLVRAVDELACEGRLPAPVFIQTGYCEYKPAYCDSEQFISPIRMQELMREAETVITHGGPSSFMEAIDVGKIPIVVPRLAKYGEHVNDHQAEFAAIVESRLGSIVVVEEISGLANAVDRVRAVNASVLNSNNATFCYELSKLIDELMRYG